MNNTKAVAVSTHAVFAPSISIDTSFVHGTAPLLSPQQGFGHNDERLFLLRLAFVSRT